ncbi:hypothetical protein [Methanobacterium alcaliphilum]|uniref:hypothetical protein n=1 Tax=Methanobacterium alcaliphilum TaxID=392018 RepID=UPI00200B29A7|nr:hypothetical protein [Methanobacterium alcaliphilum]MCK9151982.1 hypothetical protein [Methanobacterium alcaliphilum]
MSRFNLVAIVIGIMISLILTIILKLIIGDSALWILPVLAGLISVFLANETEIFGVVLIGIISGLISAIWVGPVFIILAPVGGCIAALVNGYLRPEPTQNLGKKNSSSHSRVSHIEDWFTHPQTNKLIPIIITIVLAIVLVWGLGIPAEDNTDKTADNITNNTSSISQDQILKGNVKKGVESYFKNFNSLFNQSGVTSGYIIDTITIVNLTKVSDNQVEVTVNLIRISDNGEKFNSTWSGPFYSFNGVWVDNGDFVQIKSTNQTN